MQKWHWKKIGKHYLCSEGKKRAFLLTQSVFGKSYFFVSIQNHQTLQKQGLRQAQGKIQNGTLDSKVPFWEGASKGGFTICDTQKLCSAENTIFIVFSAKYSFAETEECMLTKNRILPKWGLFANMPKGVFLFFFLGGGGVGAFVFYFLCVFVLLFC